MFKTPDDPSALAIITEAGVVTAPPSPMVRVPLPLEPTMMPVVLVHSEPAPVTMTVPWEPALSPIIPLAVVCSVPPFWMVSIPVPVWPTTSDAAVAPGPPITVGLGATVSMVAVLSGELGTVPPLQLAPVNQSVDVAPVQFCARAHSGATASAPKRTTTAAKGSRASTGHVQRDSDALGRHVPPAAKSRGFDLRCDVLGECRSSCFLLMGSREDLASYIMQHSQ
jgi:hypothetical protein